MGTNVPPRAKGLCVEHVQNIALGGDETQTLESSNESTLRAYPVAVRVCMLARTLSSRLTGHECHHGSKRACWLAWGAGMPSLIAILMGI